MTGANDTPLGPTSRMSPVTTPSSVESPEPTKPAHVLSKMNVVQTAPEEKKRKAVDEVRFVRC